MRDCQAKHIDEETRVSAIQTSTFELTPAGPFSWEQACDFVAHFPPLRRNWSGTGDPLRIAFLLDGTFEPIAVALRLKDGRLHGEVAGTAEVPAAARQVARIFALDHDGTGFPEIGRRDPAMAQVIQAFPGLRPVSFTSPYECAAWGILSQRISSRQASAIQDRLVARYGTRFEVDGGEAWAFPAPDRLAQLTEFAGLAAVKLDRLRGVASAALDGLLDADKLRALGPVDGPASLRAIPGIGPFWSSGIYLRASGIVDEFPEEPISIAALGVIHGLGEDLDPETVARLTDAYRPYRMWAAVLLRVAANRGVIPGLSGREGAIRKAAVAAGR
jgi:DNA-3-methyladenine glycosylase II